MTNSTDHTVHELPAGAPDAASRPLPLPPRDDEAARARWRRIGLRLGEIAEAEVDRLRDSQDAEDRKTDVNPAIRAIAQVVITSLRAMEMENNYDRKLEDDGGDDFAERKRRAEERAAALRRELERQYAARREHQSGGAKDIEE